METEVKEVIEKGIGDINSKIDEQSKTIEDLTSKVKTLEDRPISEKKVNILLPREYKGYNLSKQLEEKRDILKNDDMSDMISKSVIDLIKTPGLTIQEATENVMKTAGKQNEETTTAGGFLVLDAFDDMITKSAREISVMMPLVNNKSISRTDTFKFPTQNANVSVSWDDEGTVTEKSATYAQTEIAIKRLSGYVTMTKEILADSAYDIVGDISEQFSYAMAQEIDNQVLNGTGSPCSGVLTAAAGYSAVLTTGNSNFSAVTATDYSLAMSKLTGNDLNNATFVNGKLAQHYVRTLKDSNNNPIYQAIAASSPGTIYGIPQITANNITDTSAASTAFGVLGNFKEFYLINRLGMMELFIDPYSQSTSNNTVFVWATRKGLGLKRSTAFVRMITAA